MLLLLNELMFSYLPFLVSSGLIDHNAYILAFSVVLPYSI